MNTMPDRKQRLFGASETFNCPYCGKEIQVAVGPYGIICGVYRGDQTIEAQEAEKRLRTEENEKAVRKAEEKKEFSHEDL